jgi:hypothetical protein
MTQTKLQPARGMTGDKFVREYASLLQRRDGATAGDAMQSAKKALGTFESGYGVRMGSDTGRVVAAKCPYGFKYRAQA